MGMKELIEAIYAIDKPLLVYITRETYELIHEPGNNRLAFNDSQHVIHDKEDAIAALFDADIFGWSIKNFTWCDTASPWMELDVTLFKTN